MAGTKLSVGHELLAVCAQCKETKTHSITGIVRGRVARVRCKGCNGSHPFVAPPKTAQRKARRRPGKASPEAVWEKMVTLAASRKRIPYTLSGVFKENDLIDHNTFGLGVVTHLLSGKKIQVVFKDGQKILVSGR